MTNEFKAHRDLTELDISSSRYHKTINGEYNAKATRARLTLSKTICGMLNTGLKSTIYIGESYERFVRKRSLVKYQFQSEVIKVILLGFTILKKSVKIK